MGRRGPKPQPAAIKAQKGNPGNRPLGADPQAAAGVPVGMVVAPPAWLKGDGLRVWARIAPRLTTLKLLTAADVETFARYCRNFGRWLEMNRVIDRDDAFYEITTESGTVRRAHPAFMVADRLERQLLAAEDRFGLNPAERQRIFAARAQSPDPAADLFGSPGSRRANDPASKPSEPAKPSGSGSPVGFLN
jgi:P27 family predicted phage terminase small subunit